MFEHLFCNHFSLKYNFNKVYRKIYTASYKQQSLQEMYRAGLVVSVIILLFKQLKFLYLESAGKSGNNAPPVIGEWLRIS